MLRLMLCVLFVGVILVGCAQESVDASNLPVAVESEQVVDGVSQAVMCGTINSMHILVDSSARTPQEQESLDCFTNNLATCTPASLELIGDSAFSAPDAKQTVVGRQGDFCIYETFTDDCAECAMQVAETGTKRCKIPFEFIEMSKQHADAQGEPVQLYLAVTFTALAGEATNTQTGETITIDCE